MKGKTLWKTLVLSAAILINIRGIVPELRRSMSLFRRTYGMSLEEKRALLYPSLYPDLQAARREVPESATLWVVAPSEPWHINYYLYPRTLRWGSPLLKDLNQIRAMHPQDWVFSHHTLDPQQDRLLLYAPVTPAL